MPILIHLKIFLVAFTFVADQLSSFHDEHWEIAEFSFSDPIYLGISVLWLSIIAWIIHDIIKKKPGVRQTVIGISVVCAIFLAIDTFMESTFVLISFQSLELLVWVSLVFLCRSKTSENWYAKPNVFNN